ncbi:PHP domain-containing protein [Entomospira culicis]|uniref:Histidinol-phosphatase n=1 Tax=Entomospira culicis TaxID=2719989 RepID=A0A968GEL0_9SPIO|nr:PHP domain-containing protein [Entomospira culicis]NIZ18617.1 PHP domain-containing protein [Entomospira culicis]NIZ68832.1 PHP domain-containing protein [Entomospira culicis]WDI37426.1 PHP domain-containing protein [Entomospira culicis]WDI39054.1 PHP domain-containing protein [Entomospira culicis]
MLENFHTHLPYCGHASGTALEYIKQAEALQFRALGFSDHSPVPSHMYGVQGFKMKESELSLYRDEVLSAKKEATIPIYLGMEVDIISQEKAYLEEVLIPQLKPDYLLGSIHYIRLGDGSYADLGSIESAKHFDLYIEQLRWAITQPHFLFIGHADRVIMNDYVQKNDASLRDVWQAIAKLAKAHNKPMEFNTSAPLHRSEVFWQEMLREQVSVLVSSDAHAPSRLGYGLVEGYAWLEKHGAQIVYGSELLSK